MRGILFFDYAALAVLFTILLSIRVRKITSGTRNLLFLGVNILSVFTVICDILFVQVTAPAYEGGVLSKEELFFSYILLYAYYFFRNTTGFLFLLYTYSMTRTMFKIRKIYSRVILSLPFFIFVLILISNLFTGRIFTLTSEKGYLRGPDIGIVYFITILYLIIGFINLLTNKSLFSAEKWTGLGLMYLITFLAVVIQYLNPLLLVDLFASSISLLIMILVVVRPEDLTDQVVKELNFRAYVMELQKLKSTKQPVQIAAINIKNAIEVRNFLGEDLFANYLKEFISPLRKFCRKEKLSYQLYTDMPDNIYIIIDNMDFEMEKMLGLLDYRDFEASAMRLLPRLCLIRFLQDVHTIEDVVYLSRNYGDMIGSLQRFARSVDLINTREYKIRRDIDIILTRALKEKTLELYYQPIYSVEEERFVSAEALLRLNDPEYGPVPPGIFIPLAENRGLIHQIGDIVLEEVYSLVSKYDMKKLGMNYIDVNLSAAQCMRSDIVDKIHFLESRYAVKRSNIKMEITETYLGEAMDDIIFRLTDMGYDFALDDYGTGYSNIHRILELPLRIIKIDKSLVEGMKTEAGFTILKSTIEMLHNVNFKIIVEGVEDEEQYLKLKEIGADYIQGYYFSKPLPEKEFISFISEQRKASLQSP